MTNETLLQLSSSIHINRVVWIRSIKPADLPATEKVDQDLGPYFQTERLPFELFVPQSADDFDFFLGELATRASQEGVRPILFIDTHGADRGGIYVQGTGEFVSWHEFVELLRPINVATGNNLVVVSAACFSLQLVTGITTTKAAPFFIFIAAKEKFYYRPKEIVSFFKETFDGLDITSAHELHLSQQTQLVASERLLVKGLIQYIRVGCVGKGLDERKERLYLEYIAERGLTETPELKAQLFASMDAQFKPTQELVDRYVRRFLVDKRISISIGDILRAVEHSIAG